MGLFDRLFGRKEETKPQTQDLTEEIGEARKKQARQLSRYQISLHKVMRLRFRQWKPTMQN